MASVIKNFDELKRNNPGMTDSVAMKKAMDLTAKSRAKVRKADVAVSKKLSWAEKLKMAVTKKMAKKYYSPAGRKHNPGKKGY
jgi:hypothetical protein